MSRCPFSGTSATIKPRFGIRIFGVERKKELEWYQGWDLGDLFRAMSITALSVFPN